MKEEGIRVTFTADTYYEGTGCDTRVTYEIKSERLGEIAEAFSDFLKGVGFSDKKINEHVKYDEAQRI